MSKKCCILLALVNLILGVVATCIYLPYFFEAFNMNVSGWSNAIHKLLSENYYKVLIWFGIVILTYIIVINVVTAFSSKSIAGFSFKLASAVTLVLPLIYILALQFDSILNLWIKYIAPNVKTISLIVVIVSCGLLLLGIIASIVKKRQINIYLLIQCIAMCALLILLVSINGWCGWEINYVKGFGALMAVLPIYLLVSVVILILNAKNNQRA